MVRSPKSVGGKNTQTVHVQLAEGEDIDTHCKRARQAGAEILQEPETHHVLEEARRAKNPSLVGEIGSHRLRRHDWMRVGQSPNQ